MEEFILSALYSVVTLLYGSCFCLLFLGVPWNEHRIYWSFLGYVIVTLGFQGIVMYYFSVQMVVYLYPLIVHVPLFLLCTLYYGKSILNTVSSIMMCYFLTSPRYILAKILVFVFPNLPGSENMGKVIVSFLLAYPIYKWFVPVMQKSFQRKSRDVMHFFVPLTILYTFSYLLYVYTDLLKTNGVFMMEIIFTFFFIFIFYYLQKYFVSIDDILEKEQRNQLLAVSTEALKKQLDILKESNEQTRILRHDMRHYATMVKQYAQMGDMDKVVCISEEIETKNQAVVVKTYCSNPWINLLLNVYMAQMEEAGVEHEVETSVPVEINIRDMDLCVVLGNVLDNAMRSINAGKGKRFCSILLRYDDGKLYLEVQNSCESPVSFHNGIPLSVREGHGYGCKSIEYIVEKYCGICSFRLEETTFITQVILHEQ